MGNFDHDDRTSIAAEVRFAEHGPADFALWAGELASTGRPGILGQLGSIAAQVIRHTPPALVIRYLW